jgi:hypothetical protein
MDEWSGAPREFNTEPVDLDEVADALREDEGVDTRRVRLAMHDDELVLGGSVASPEEADRALDIAEQSGLPVVNELEVDPALREGAEDPCLVEEVDPAEGELLVGGDDLRPYPDGRNDDLTGTDEDENEPMDPPDEPLFPRTPIEDRGALTPGRPAPEVDELGGAEELGGDDRPAAADLTEEDLRWAAAGGRLPSLDPELDATTEERAARRGLAGEADQADETGEPPREG